MTCYHPLAAITTPYKHVKTGKTALSIIGSVEKLQALGTLPKTYQGIPCGQCIGCRLANSTSWAIRAMHEESRWYHNCFITLTYNNEHLPIDGSLVKSHFQDFMKNLRQARLRQPQKFLTETQHPDYKREGKAPIRYFHCGEYGERLQRPHYHALLFNLDFSDKQLFKTIRGNKIYKSETLATIWGKGYASIGALTYDSAMYVARYILKKKTGPEADQHYTTIDDNGQIHENIAPEYTTMSTHPGIAKKWFDEYGDEVFPDDEVILKGKHRARVLKPPRYYEKLTEKTDPELMQEVKRLREIFAENHLHDSTPDRLQTRESVKTAQLGQCKRTYETGET